MMSTLTVENRKVLVLNKQFAAINVCPMKRALRLLFSWHDELRDTSGKIIRPSEPKARIYDPSQDFTLWTWEDWSMLRPKPGEAGIGAAAETFRLPEIILLSRYDKMPSQRVHFSRKTIYKRDNHTCQYCGCRPGDGELSIDHVLPRAQGGLTTWENCVLACVACNSQKADRRPEQAFKNRKDWRGPSPMRLLAKPRKPKYTFFKGDRMQVPKSWDQFLSEVFWETELVNDNS
jgi:5-methylcytosine-specific restriction endonuclease McrA